MGPRGICATSWTLVKAQMPLEVRAVVRIHFEKVISSTNSITAFSFRRSGTVSTTVDVTGNTFLIEVLVETCAAL